MQCPPAQAPLRLQLCRTNDVERPVDLRTFRITSVPEQALDGLCRRRVLGAVVDPAMLLGPKAIGFLERKKRIEQVINGDVVGPATREAIEAMQAAVMVAVIMPAVST